MTRAEYRAPIAARKWAERAQWYFQIQRKTEIKLPLGVNSWAEYWRWFRRQRLADQLATKPLPLP